MSASPSPASPTPRRRPGRLRRWILRPLIWLAVLAGTLLAVALWLLHQPSVQRQIAEHLLPRLESYLGHEVRVGQARFGLFPLWLDLRDVILAGPGPGDPPVLVADRLYAEADITQLWRSRLRIETITVEGAEVYVERFADGLLNIPRPAPRERRGDRPFELEIGRVELLRGVFFLDEESLPLELSAHGVSLSFLGLGSTGLRGTGEVEEVEILLPRAAPYRVSLAGTVELGRHGLLVRSGEVRAPDGLFQVTGEVGWGERSRVRLHVKGEMDSELFRRLEYLDEEGILGTARVDGTFAWEPGVWGFRGDLTSPRLQLLGWTLTQVRGAIAGDRNAVWVDIDDSRYAGGTVRGRVEVALEERRVTELDLHLQQVDLERFLRDSEIPVENLAGRLSGELSYHFLDADWRAGEGWGTFQVHGEIAAQGVPVAGSVPLVVERGVVRSTALRLFTPEQQATATALYDLSTQRGEIAFVIDSADLGRLAPLLPLVLEEAWPLWLPELGTGTVAGILTLAPEGNRTEIHLDLRDVAAPGAAGDRLGGQLVISRQGLDGLRLELTREGGAMLVTGVIPFDQPGAPQAWLVALDVASWPLSEAAPWLPTPLPLSGPFTGSITLAGLGDEVTGAVLGEVSPARAWGIDVERVRARLSWDDEGLQVPYLVVESPAGELVGAGSLGFLDQSLEASIAGRGLDLRAEPLASLTGDALSGSLSLAGGLSGTLEGPALDLEVTGDRLEVGGRSLGDRGHAALTVGWRDGKVRSEGSFMGVVELAGGGILDSRRVDLAFDVEVPDLGLLASLAGRDQGTVTGRARGALAIAGPLGPGEPPPSAVLTLAELEGRLAGYPLINLEPVELELGAGELRMRSLYLGDPDGGSEVFVAGALGLEAPHALDLRVQSTLDNRWFEPLLPELQLTGQTDFLATVRGDLAEPLVNGQAEIQGARLISIPLGQSVEDLRAILLFYPDALVVDTLQGQIGGGALRASGRVGWPTARSPLDARLQIAVDGATLRYPEGWTLRGDADLVWGIDAQGQLLRGVVNLDRAFYLRNVETGPVQLLQRFFRHERREVGETDERLSAVGLNLVVRAPGAVRVRNNLADLRGSAELTFRGTLARPILFGYAEAEPGGKLVYADSEYRIERGTLTFANPYRIEPLLDLVARTEVAQYEVTLSLFGNLDRLHATFASDPPLPDLEVLSLLVSGAPAGLDGLAARRPGEDTASAAEGLLLGQASSLVGQRVGSLFGVDAFRIEPLTSSGDATKTWVTVGKRLTSDLYVTYSHETSTAGEQRLRVEWQVADGFKLLLAQEEDAYAVDLLWERSF